MNTRSHIHCVMKSGSSTPRGVSLIEMLIMISLISVIFTVGVTMLAFLMRVELQGTERIQTSLNLQRLATQFRTDVVSARKASILTDESSKISKLSLDTDGDTSIVYSSGHNLNGQFISRVIHKSDKTYAYDEFRIPESQIQFLITPANESELAALKLIFPMDQSHENKTVKIPHKTLIFDAMIDRKHSYLTDGN